MVMSNDGNVTAARPLDETCRNLPWRVFEAIDTFQAFRPYLIKVLGGIVFLVINCEPPEPPSKDGYLPPSARFIVIYGSGCFFDITTN